MGGIWGDFLSLASIPDFQHCTELYCLQLCYNIFMNFNVSKIRSKTKSKKQANKNEAKRRESTVFVETREHNVVKLL